MTEYVPLGFGSHARKPEPAPASKGKDEMPEEITSLPEGTVILTVTFIREDRDGLKGVGVDWNSGRDKEDKPHIDTMLALRLMREAADSVEALVAPYAMILKWLEGKVED